MQTLEFQFLAGYALTVDVILLGQLGPTAADLACTESSSVSAAVSRYQTTTTGLLGHYVLDVKHLGVTVMTTRILVDASAGHFYGEDVVGLTLPNADRVYIGIDRGDGVLGTLVPCFAPTRTVTSDIDVVFVPNQLVELLTITGGRTHTLATVMKVRDNNLYEVAVLPAKKLVTLSRDRLAPIFQDVA